MQAEVWDPDRAAVAVVSRVGDVGELDGAVESGADVPAGDGECVFKLGGAEAHGLKFECRV